MYDLLLFLDVRVRITKIFSSYMGWCWYSFL